MFLARDGRKLAEAERTVAVKTFRNIIHLSRKSNETLEDTVTGLTKNGR